MRGDAANRNVYHGARNVAGEADARKKEFMEWLDGEIERRRREREVAALVNEMMVEEQLGELRRKREISQARLAQLMGVQYPLIPRLESGRIKNLTLATVARRQR